MEKDISKKRVFLVEDDSAIIDVYSTAFKVAGVDLEVITLGEQAISKIKETVEGEGGVPAVVLLDLILPDMNGAEVLKAIKTDKKTENIPVYILSNQTSLDLEKPGGINPDKFIIKADITPLQLVEEVKSVLN